MNFSWGHILIIKFVDISYVIFSINSQILTSMFCCNIIYLSNQTKVKKYIGFCLFWQRTKILFSLKSSVNICWFCSFLYWALRLLTTCLLSVPDFLTANKCHFISWSSCSYVNIRYYDIDFLNFLWLLCSTILEIFALLHSCIIQASLKIKFLTIYFFCILFLDFHLVCKCISFCVIFIVECEI